MVMFLLLRLLSSMRKRFLLSFSKLHGWHVQIPSYSMVPGSFEPVTSGLVSVDGIESGAQPADVLALGASVLCEIPDDWAVDSSGDLDVVALRRLYRNHFFYGTLDFDVSRVEVRKA